MQELIDQMWEIAKYGDSYEVAPCIEAAEAMLEKEKEVIMNAYDIGWSDGNKDQDLNDLYYFETFNTKEK